MPSVDPSQVPSLVVDTGYKPALEAYTRDPLVFPEIFEVMPCDGTSYGWTEMSIAGTTEPVETERGQDAHARTMDEVYQWFCKERKLQEMIVLPEEMLRSPNAQALIQQHIRSHIPGLAAGFAQKKERMAAAIFNYGSYTAGRTDAFVGSYLGHTDPNNGKIYDGKPFFAASGNGHPLGLATSTTKVNQDANTLTATNLDSAYILHTSTNAYSEANEFMGGNRPDVLLVPPGLESTADVLINSTLRPGTANNDKNTYEGRFKRITWSYLTVNSSGWFLGGAKQGIRVYDSGVPEIIVSEPDRNNGNVTVRLVSYFGVVVRNWRPWSAHNTATS